MDTSSVGGLELTDQTPVLLGSTAMATSLTNVGNSFSGPTNPLVSRSNKFQNSSVEDDDDVVFIEPVQPPPPFAPVVSDQRTITFTSSKNEELQGNDSKILPSSKELASQKGSVSETIVIDDEEDMETNQGQEKNSSNFIERRPSETKNRTNDVDFSTSSFSRSKVNAGMGNSGITTEPDSEIQIANVTTLETGVSSVNDGQLENTDGRDMNLMITHVTSLQNANLGDVSNGLQSSNFGVNIQTYTPSLTSQTKTGVGPFNPGRMNVAGDVFQNGESATHHNPDSWISQSASFPRNQKQPGVDSLSPVASLPKQIFQPSAQQQPTKPVKVTCANCKKPLQKGQTAYQRKGSAHLFCSTTCLSSFSHKPAPKKLCVMCKKDITTMKGTIVAQVDSSESFQEFCSTSCLSLYEDKQNPTKGALNKSRCTICGKLTEIRHEVSFKNMTHKLCSDHCFNRYRMANGLIMNCCEQCGEYLPSKGAGNNVLVIDGQQKRFCCQSCVSEYKQVGSHPSFLKEVRDHMQDSFLMQPEEKMSRENERKELLEEMVNEVLDMSDEEVDLFSDDSEECRPSGDSGDSSDSSCSPPRKTKRRTLHTDLSSGEGCSKSITETIEAVVADFSESDSSSDVSEEPVVTSVSSLTWGPVSGSNMKIFDFVESNPGVPTEIAVNLHEKTPYDFFKFFITDDVIDYMVKETNIYASQTLQKGNVKPHSRLKKWYDVTSQEMERFLGVLFWMGLSKKPRLPDYWSKNILYDNSVKKLISRNRFEMLLRMWHFSNNEECPPGDRLFKIQPLLDRLVERFQVAVVPDKEICIEETMVPFHGRLSFIQYVKNKCHKFGIKLFKLCLKDGYTWNVRIYCGKEARSGIPVSSSVVMKLIEGLLDSGHVLYTDNYYTSIHLAHQLLERSTYLVGTLRSNRKLNPPDVVKAKLNKNEVIARESDTGVVVLKWKDKRDVLMLSTMHGEDTKVVETRKGVVEKPHMIVDYNNSKAFVDLSDQLKSYSCSLRRGIKWFRKLAIELITGSALVNSLVLYRVVNKKKISITKFKEQVCLKLLQTDETSTVVLSLPMPSVTCSLMNMGSARRRCTVCYEKTQAEKGREYAMKRCKQTAWKCSKCNVYFCVECFFLKHTSMKK
ncbi:zinc finger MYM-type protein 2 isoform X3 [Microcebus murinus]|uniref:zinc finger MYM-type protein 2 isoform X3 n=1 Tax=Microcebus murinus TaxID=30608 RepID=UPI0006429723|nr:zinc finger MYM-type protein 2 isoform X4 [Microcebus murinus]